MLNCKSHTDWPGLSLALGKKDGFFRPFRTTSRAGGEQKSRAGTNFLVNLKVCFFYLFFFQTGSLAATTRLGELEQALQERKQKERKKEKEDCRVKFQR